MFEERHEIIKFPPHIPIKVFMHKLGVVARHWHSDLELLLVLEGQIDINIDDDISHLKSEDIIIINPNSIHEIHSESAVMIALQLKLEKYYLTDSPIDNLTFQCNSSAEPDKTHYKRLQYYIAQMVNNNAHRSEGTDYRNYALSYYLIAELLEYFRIPTPETVRIKRKYVERLTDITTYINEHYKENFSLRDLAEVQNLSVPYLSSFFNKYMGIKFSQYYTNVKLEHAIEDLLNTNDSIETIALNHGFTESHTFIRAFKSRYNILPSVYRKEERNPNESVFPQNLNYFCLEPSSYLHLLTKYLKNDASKCQPPGTDKYTSVDVPEVSADSPGKKLRHSFKKFISVGRAKDILNYNIQNMLKDIQKNIGYEYIKFHGILSDDMNVCTRESSGTLRFHYYLVDQVIEFLLSIGLKPMIQLSFMPLALASDPQKNVGQNPFNTSPPSDMSEWNMLIEDFTRHLLLHFGYEEVVTWLFTVWNEPCTSKKMFGFGDDMLFFDFYRNTYQTVKKVCPKLFFGTPSLLYFEPEKAPIWIINFLNYTKKHGCRPDFLNIHYYSDIVPPTADDFVLQSTPSSKFPICTDDFSFYIGSIKKTFRKLGVDSLPIYLTEWNFTMSHRNLINDTCFKSCYILKNLLKNYDRLDSFGYWSLTDMLEEIPLPDHLFHGGLGIYTINGIRKNVFYSFYFANMLGDVFLSSGDGWFVTKKNQSYQIITYNYEHYGNLFAAGELFDITQTNRYSPFNMTKKLSISIPITGLENGNYTIKEYFINREHGSAYDLWVSMGGIPLSSADLELLRSISVPGFHTENKFVHQNTITYNAQLEPLEIRFSEIILLETTME